MKLASVDGSLGTFHSYQHWGRGNSRLLCERASFENVRGREELARVEGFEPEGPGTRSLVSAQLENFRFGLFPEGLCLSVELTFAGLHEQHSGEPCVSEAGGDSKKYPTGCNNIPAGPTISSAGPRRESLQANSEKQQAMNVNR